MSRLARENPEDERYQSLEGQRDVLVERADRSTAEVNPADLQADEEAARERAKTLPAWHEDSPEFKPIPRAGEDGADHYEGRMMAWQDEAERRYDLFGADLGEERDGWE